MIFARTWAQQQHRLDTGFIPRPSCNYSFPSLAQSHAVCRFMSPLSNPIPLELALFPIVVGAVFGSQAPQSRICSWETLGTASRSASQSETQAFVGSVMIKLILQLATSSLHLSLASIHHIENFLTARYKHCRHANATFAKPIMTRCRAIFYRPSTNAGITVLQTIIRTTNTPNAATEA